MGEDVVMVWKKGHKEGDCKMAQSGLLAGYRLLLFLTHKGVSGWGYRGQNR